MVFWTTRPPTDISEDDQTSSAAGRLFFQLRDAFAGGALRGRHGLREVVDVTQGALENALWQSAAWQAWKNGVCGAEAYNVCVVRGCLGVGKLLETCWGDGLGFDCRSWRIVMTEEWKLKSF